MSLSSGDSSSCRRRAVLLFVTIALLFCAVRLSRVSMDTSIAAFFPDSDGAAQEMARLAGDSPLSRLVFVALESDDPAALAAAVRQVEAAVPPDLARPLSGLSFTPRLLVRLLPSFFDAGMQQALDDLNLEAMRQRLREAKKLLGVSMGGEAWVRGDPLQLSRLLREKISAGHAPPAAPAPGLTDGRHALILLNPAVEPGKSLPTGEAMRLLEILRQTAASLPEGVSLRFSGGAIHAAVNAQTIQQDIVRIAGLSLPGFALAYLLLARSWGAVWILATAFGSMLCALAGSTLVWPTASGLALGFGAALMGVAEDYAVHTHFALRSVPPEAGPSGLSEERAAILPPLFQSWLLNLSGFCVLFFSGIPAIRQLAFLSAASLTTGFLLAVHVLPLLPGFAGPPIPLRVRHREPRQLSWSRLALAAILLALAFPLLLHRVEPDVSPRRLGADVEALSRDAELIRRLQAENVPLLTRGASWDEALEASRRLAQALRAAFPGAIIDAPAELAPSAGESAANLRRWRDWPGRAAFLSRLDEAARAEGFSVQAFQPFREALHLPAQALPLPLLEEIPEAELLFFSRGERFYCVLRARGLPPDWRVPPKSLPADDRLLSLDERDLERRLGDLFRQETWLVPLEILVCLLLLGLTLRRPARVLAVCLPPAVSLGAALLALIVFEAPLTLTALLALPVVIGLALDHGIMVSHSLESGRDSGVRRAVLLSSVTAFLGMGLLALAEHPALRSMGLVIFTGLAAEVFAALCLLPLLYRGVR